MSRLILPLLSLSLILICHTWSPVEPQTRERTVSRAKDDVIKVDVNLVVLDALVLQQKTGRVVGNLKQEDFILAEDGVRQRITHFSQDTLPLSVIILIDRGGCLDPFGTKVHHATIEALSRLKPSDEVALMAYHNKVDLIEGFTRDRTKLAEALDRIPGHDEEANHCLNRAFYEAAQYMVNASNPVSRRVIIVITGVTSNFDCSGPSGTAARHEVYESGSVVCGLIPRSPAQQVENGATRMATGIAGIFKAPTLSIKQLADETGGEILEDKPEYLDSTFNTLMDHLRTRYSMGFVSSNKKHDGSVRKLKLEITPAAQRAAGGKLVVKTRRSYIAPKDEAEHIENHIHK